MNRLLAWLVAATCLTVVAEVKRGENVLLNGRFETDQTDMPLYWSVGGPSGTAVWEPTGGPGGIPCMTFRAVKDRKGEFTIRQYGIGLATNGTYRISAQIRTRGFHSRHNGATVVNQGWYSEQGPRMFAADQPWTRVEKTFRPVPSKDGKYSAVVFAIDPVGELSVADFRIEALDEPALAGTVRSSADKAGMRPRLVPWGIDPRYVPSARPEIPFRCFGKLPDSGCDLVLGETKIPLQARKTTVMPLPRGAKSGVLEVKVVDRAGGTNLCSSTFDYRVVAPVATDGHRRLNNLVTEVLKFKTDGKGGSRRFTTTRDGWVFIAVRPLDRSGRVKVRLDGRQVMDGATPRQETFREVDYGEHELAVEGIAAGGEVVVRQIAEVFNYCPGVNSMVGENFPYDWEFQKRNAHCAVTTQNGGSVPSEHLEWFHRQGYRWLANLGTTKLKDANDLTKRLESAAGMTNPNYDGLTCDEQFFGQAEMLGWYIDGLRAYSNPLNRRIYTWIVGKPGCPGVDHDFLWASRAASHGRGKVLFEAYCRTRATEEEARSYLDSYVTDTLRRYREWCPGIETSTGIEFGDFNQVPILSLAHHPEVDYKYYLDMQLNLVANNPEFRNLGCVGYWGSYYADHELHRWALRLLRHYCVDGETGMLSERHGFRYLPGHLVNGDFRGSLEGWKASGSVGTDKVAGFGSRSQNRWGGNGSLGDTFAVFTAMGSASPNSLAQTLKGLVPGRKYCLQFATFDVDDAKANRIAPRRFGIKATLGEAAKLEHGLCWVHVDKRTKGRYSHNDGVARINLHHLVFTAGAAEIPLVFDDADAKAGEHLGLNYVSLNPFYEEAYGLVEPAVWSRDNQATLKRTADGTYEIRHSGQQDWCIHGEPALGVRPGDVVRISCDTKALPDFSEPDMQCSLSVTLRDARGEVLDWCYGSSFARVGQPISTEFMIPPEGATILPRVVGNGRCGVAVKNFKVEMLGNRLAGPANPSGSAGVETKSLKVAVSNRGAALSVTDKRTGRTWAPAKPGRMFVTDVRREGETLKVEFVEPLSMASWQAVFQPVADKAELLVTLHGDGAMPSVFDYPAPFASRKGDRVIIPMNEGIAFAADDPEGAPTRLPTYSGHGVCMAFFGVQEDATGAGYMAIVETADDAAVTFPRQPLLGGGVSWESQKGQFGYPRRVRYVFFDRGGYVAMCKRYRAYAKEQGKLKTFAEKAKTRPLVDRLLGAPNIWCWEGERMQMAADFKAAGIDRYLWSAGGDEKSVSALAKMDGVLVSCYDVYRDIYRPEQLRKLGWKSGGTNTEAWPEGAAWDSADSNNWRKAWSVKAPDGTWTYCACMCDAVSAKFCRRKVSKELKTKPYNTRFVDVTTAAGWDTCHNPAHPMNRGDSRAYRMDLLRLLGDEFGLVVGSETGHDAAVPYCDYFEGMLSLCHYRVPESGRYITQIWTNAPATVVKFQVGEKYRLPLWELVYHDCLCAHWYWGDYNNKLPSLWDRRDLFNALYGTMGMYIMANGHWKKYRDRFVKSYRLTSPIARKTGYSEMTDHRVLTADRSVQRTEFANGVTVTVNFGNTAYRTAEGREIPAGGCVTTGL